VTVVTNTPPTSSSGPPANSTRTPADVRHRPVAGTWFSPEEEARLNQTADLLNSKLSSASGARGFGFANPTSRFVGHAVCDDVEWLNGLSSPVSESYHPNKAGHSSGYAPAVSPLLTGAPARITTATYAAARANEEDLATQQRSYAAQDASITPAEFRVPNLRSAESRAQAREAGVNIKRWLARHG